MIVHLRVPDFCARVFQVEESLESKPVVVRDESRLISLTPEARALGLESGSLMENVEIPEEVIVKDFRLEEIVRVNRQFRQLAQDLSPLVEGLELGENFVEVESTASAKEWFKNQSDYDYPLAGAAAPTGWLARVVSGRQEAGEFEVVDVDDYEDTIQSVRLNEMWGLGSKVMETLAEHGIKQMGELFYLEETERRKLLGKYSRILHLLFNMEDPRPISVFSRPRSLSQEIPLAPEEKQQKDDLCEQLDEVMSRVQDRLLDTVSLAYRCRMGLRFEEEENLTRTHVFTTPTDDHELFSFAVRKMTADVALTKPAKSAAVETDVIVANIANYHSQPQEVPTDLEILKD